jgi:amino acid transporter
MAEDDVETDRELKRDVGLGMLTAIGVGATVGAPIFVILGSATRMAGTSTILSFVIGGLLTLLVGLTYSELSTTFPESGGGYTFAKKAYGGMPAFLTGWLMAFTNIVFGSLSALGFAQIVGFAWGAPILLSIPVALVTLFVFTLLNLWGIKGSGMVQLVLVLIMVVGLGLVVGFAAFFVSPSNLAPSAPLGWGGTLAATSFVFVSYFGFETIANVSEEAKHPARTLAISTLASIAICTAIYVAMSAVAIGVVGWHALAGSASPLMLVGATIGGIPGAVLVAVVGAIATLTSLNAALLASSRTIFALSRDGLLPKGVAAIDRRGVPAVAITLVALLMAAFISTGGVDFVAYMADFSLFLALILISLGLVVLRRKRGILERPFRSPLVLTVGSVALLAVFMMFLQGLALAAGIAIVLFGIILYLLMIAPAANRALTLGGVSAAAGLTLLACLGIGGWNLQLRIGLAALQLAPLLLAGSVFLLFGGFLCVTPLGGILRVGLRLESASPKLLKRMETFENLIAICVAAFGAAALIVFYLAFHGGVTFPALQAYKEGYRFLLLLCLGGFSLATTVVGLFLWQRHYPISTD